MSITCGSEELQEERFSPDGRFLMLPTETAPGQRCIALYDIAAKRKLWERTVSAHFGNCDFTADASAVISALQSQVEVIDVATGLVRFTIDLPNSRQLDPFLSRDGRTLYVLCQPGPAEPTLWRELLEEYWPWPPRDPNDLEREPFPVHAYDFATGRELWRQETPFASQYWVSDDRVVTLHDHFDSTGVAVACTIRCWEVPPRKRLEWIIGTPLGVGGVLLAARAGWRRFRSSAAAR
jgi:hypothetical protein